MLEQALWTVGGLILGHVGYLLHAKKHGLAPFHRPRFNLEPDPLTMGKAR
jgi:hypothetical protein